jgi:hypothetical protein
VSKEVFGLDETYLWEHICAYVTWEHIKINQCKVGSRSKETRLWRIVHRVSVPGARQRRVAADVIMKRQRHIELIGMELGRIMCNKESHDHVSGLRDSCSGLAGNAANLQGISRHTRR